MFSPIKDVQKEAEFVYIEDLVPQNHLLRKVDNERFGFNVEAVGLDSDFLTNSICKGLHDRNILGL